MLHSRKRHIAFGFDASYCPASCYCPAHDGSPSKHGHSLHPYEAIKKLPSHVLFQLILQPTYWGTYILNPMNLHMIPPSPYRSLKEPLPRTLSCRCHSNIADRSTCVQVTFGLDIDINESDLGSHLPVLNPKP